MLIKSLIFILLFPIAQIGFAESMLQPTQLFDIKDLEVLESQRSYDEFLLHVNDIRPSERGKHWKEMLQNVGLLLIEYKLKSKDFSPKSFNQIELLGRSSALIEDELFQLRRIQYGEKYLVECFKKIEDKAKCENDLNTFWYFTNKDAELGLYLASLLLSNNSNIDRWPFYRAAITDAAAPIYCAKSEIQKAIITKINQESFSEKFDNNYQALLNRLVPDKCFEKMIPSIREAIIRTETSGTDKELAINLLEAKKLLSKDDQDLFAILFLLSGPVVGDKMNTAWKKVELLSESFPKRQKILGMLKNLEVLPDQIFTDPNLPRNKAIINLFAKNFPELLDFYGKSCLEYIQRKNDENNIINSAFHCHQFLTAAKINPLWLSDAVKLQYSSIKK